jgi:hypothetical protein
LLGFKNKNGITGNELQAVDFARKDKSLVGLIGSPAPKGDEKNDEKTFPEFH